MKIFCDVCSLQYDELNSEHNNHEESFSEKTGFKKFMQETFNRRMEIVEQIQNERDSVHQCKTDLH